MERFAQITNGLVSSIVSAEKQDSDKGLIGPVADFVIVGWRYIGDDFLPPETYEDRRLNAYPPIGDQLDAMFHAGVFPDDMAAKLQAVKAAHPKE
jgi:hypothetical protein